MSDDEEETTYQIRDPARGSAGKALIINVLNKSSSLFRVGSSNDVMKIKEVLEHLNLKVVLAQSEDPTAQEIKDEIKKFRESLKTEFEGREGDFDMVAICLMGHGEEGIIYGQDLRNVDLRGDVFDAFSNKNCPVLSGKPRLFFIQACRGDKEDEGIDGSSTIKRGRGTDHPPNQPNQRQKRKAALDDTVRAYSCLENYVAFRSQKGAHFIDSIHQVFLKHATEEENIDKLLKRVKRKLDKKFVDKDVFPTCEYRSSLSKDLYFKPKST